MPDPIEFRNATLSRVYAAVEQSLASLSQVDREQRLAQIGSQLTALDSRQDLSEPELQRAAQWVVRAFEPAGPSGRPVPTTPRRTSATDSVIRPGGVELVPGVALDSQTGIPLVDGRAPDSWGQAATAFYGLGVAIDRRMDGNLLAGVGIRQRAALLDRIEQIFSGKSFDPPPAEALTTEQAAQLRGSAATALHEIIESVLTDDSPAARQVLVRALNLGFKTASAEIHRGLRDSMVFGLYRYQRQLPNELQPITRQLMREVAPLTPPYDAWLSDGKITFDFVVDNDAVDIAELQSQLRSMGFSLVEGSNPPIMRRTAGTGDKEAVVEARMRINHRTMFENVGDEEIDIVMYLGHSNYGRAAPASLGRVPNASGKNQLIMLGMCFGKDNIEHVRQRFPEAEIMGTFNSAYVSQLFRMVRALNEGINSRKSWTSIRRGMGGQRSSNWVSPADVMLRRRIMDRDGDGRADILDRLYDVNLQSVEASLQQAFVPLDPGAPPHELQALYGVIAANWLNRGVGGYNESVKALNRASQVSCAGFFSGESGDPPVRFTSTTLPDGQSGWTMEINDRFAHMPEEALRAVAAYEFNLHLAQTNQRFHFHDDPLGTRINGLMAAAFSLGHDRSYNDTLVWKALLDAYGFPPDINMHELERHMSGAVSSSSEIYGGSRAAVRAYIKQLTAQNPNLLAALRADEIGAWRPPSS